MKGFITGETRADAADGARHTSSKSFITTALMAGSAAAWSNPDRVGHKTTKSTMHSFDKKPIGKFSAIRCFAAVSAALSLFVAAWPGNGLAQDKAAVLLPGSINDQSWNAQGYSGVTKLKSLGWDVAYSENVQPSDMAEALQDYSRKGYTLIIGHTGRFLSPMEMVGPKFVKNIHGRAPGPEVCRACDIAIF